MVLCPVVNSGQLVAWCQEESSLLPQESFYLPKVNFLYESVTEIPKKTNSWNFFKFTEQVYELFCAYLLVHIKLIIVRVGKPNLIICYYYPHTSCFLVSTIIYHKEPKLCIITCFRSVHCTIYIPFSWQLRGSLSVTLSWGKRASI